MSHPSEYQPLMQLLVPIDRAAVGPISSICSRLVLPSPLSSASQDMVANSYPMCVHLTSINGLGGARVLTSHAHERVTCLCTF